MKKLLTLVAGVTVILNMSACSPVVVVGAAAGAGVSVATDRRSTGKMVEDQAIEVRAHDFIYSHEEFGKTVHVAATSVNGTVLLTGEVPKAEYSKIIADRIYRMRPVVSVINKIEVGEKLSVTDRSHDVWMTSKIKSNLLIKKGLLSRT